jgi:hypothetical protein
MQKINTFTKDNMIMFIVKVDSHVIQYFHYLTCIYRYYTESIRPTDESLSKVNNFEAIEISSEIGKITFSGDKTVKVYLNLWYSSAEEKKLMIVEFTFKYGAKEQDEGKNMFLEEYSNSLVLGVGAFYQSLQNDNMVDSHTTKTKTDLAYQEKYKS